MAYGKPRSVYSLRSGLGAAPTRGQAHRWPDSRPYWLLLSLFVGLQIADIITTNHALEIPGIWEANPLMALSQAKLGAAWWLPKLAGAGYLCVAASQPDKEVEQVGWRRCGSRFCGFLPC